MPCPPVISAIDYANSNSTFLSKLGMGFRESFSRILKRIAALFDPTPPVHTLYATRTLPYETLALYNLITDIPSYSAFVPYVVAARVTDWSPRPDAQHNRRWPAVAAIEVAFGNFAHETFSSHIVCEPPTEQGGEGVVEAFGGDAVPGVSPEHYDPYVPDGQGHGPVRLVRAEWRVKQIESGRAQLRLRVEYAFRSQAFEMTGNSMARKVTDQVADAFVTRAKALLGKT